MKRRAGESPALRLQQDRRAAGCRGRGGGHGRRAALQTALRAAHRRLIRRSAGRGSLPSCGPACFRSTRCWTAHCALGLRKSLRNRKKSITWTMKRVRAMGKARVIDVSPAQVPGRSVELSKARLLAGPQLFSFAKREFVPDAVTGPSVSWSAMNQLPVNSIDARRTVALRSG